MNPRISVVIPTLNRPFFITRAMKYWSNKSVNVVVIDGSTEALAPKDLSVVGPNVIYRHAPVSLLERMHLATELIRTEYVQFAGDDEFFVPSAMDECAHVLDRNPDFVSCCGRAVGFAVDDGTVTGFPVYPEFRGYQINGDSPGDRMRMHMSAYTCSTFYAITRREAWIKAVRFAAANPLPFYAAPEILVELALSFLGKSSVLPILWWFRSGEAPPTRDTELFLNPRQDFYRWWTSADSKSAIEELISRFAAEFGSAHESVDSRAEVTSALNALEQFFLPYHRGVRVRFSTQIEPFFPPPLRILTKQVLSYVPRKGSRNLPLDRELLRLQLDAVSFDTHAVVEIENAIRGESKG